MDSYFIAINNILNKRIEGPRMEPEQQGVKWDRRKTKIDTTDHFKFMNENSKNNKETRKQEIHQKWL